MISHSTLTAKYINTTPAARKIILNGYEYCTVEEGKTLSCKAIKSFACTLRGSERERKKNETNTSGTDQKVSQYGNHQKINVERRS
jgi:hypothetical protein